MWSRQRLRSIKEMHSYLNSPLRKSGEEGEDVCMNIKKEI